MCPIKISSRSTNQLVYTIHPAQKPLGISKGRESSLSNFHPGRSKTLKGVPFLLIYKIIQSSMKV